MSLEEIWGRFQQGGYDAVSAYQADLGEEAFYLAVLAFGHDDYQRAGRHVDRAAALDPDNLVYRYARPYLQHVVEHGKAQVYASAEGFQAFIRDGGNVPLYEATSAKLREIYSSYSSLTLLDVGVGDGLALLPALTDNVSDLTLIEPQEGLLTQTQTALEGRGIACTAFHGTLQDAVQHFDRRWDLVQATYSMQSVPPGERVDLLRWLREHSDRLLIAEFDPPEFNHIHMPDYVQSVLRRYQVGLAEYDDEQRALVQEFLIPVMFGYFDQSAERTNYEQPLNGWLAQLRETGYGEIVTYPLYAYWWAPAYLIDARH